MFTNTPLPPQSSAFAGRLRTVGAPVALVPVRRTGHTLDAPGQDPGPARLTATVADFLSTTLR